MKKRTMLLIFAFLFLMSSIGYCSDWTYAGKFVLRNNIQHCVDIYILNHLQPYTGQVLYSKDSYSLFDVYYQHDHSTDKEFTGRDAYGCSLTITGNIVPLNVKGEPMQSNGSYCGNIISVVNIATRGAFSVNAQSFEVWDRINGNLLFEGKGTDLGHEQLYTDTALEKIINLSGPHFSKTPVVHGYGYYSYR